MDPITQLTEIILVYPDGKKDEMAVYAPCPVRKIPGLAYKVEEGSKIPYEVFGIPGNWKLLVAKHGSDFEEKEEGLDYVCKDDDIIKWEKYQED